MLIFYLFAGLFPHEIFTNCKKIKCGVLPESKSITSYIIGGNETTYMQYPWIAAVMYFTGWTWEQYCAAGIINSKFILTAGHCVFNPEGERVNDVSKFLVIIGTNKINNKSNEQRYRKDEHVKQVILHEDYDYNLDKNDIALMELKNPIMFKKTKIRPLCLPSKIDENYLFEEQAIVAGWGLTNPNDDGSNVDKLVAVNLLVANYSTCNKQLDELKKHTYLYNSTICTFNNGSGKDACGGDSGGPLMAIHRVTRLVYFRGIVSFGSSMCCGYGVFTKVSYFLDWIYKNTGINYSCFKSG